MCKENTAIRLKRIMDERNLRQVDVLELAKPFCEKYKVKLSKSDLSQYCSGKTEPHQDKLYILASALNLSESWLMGFDVPMERHKSDEADRFAAVANVYNDQHQNRMMLSDREKNHIFSYKKLSDDGKDKADAYIDRLLKEEKETEEEIRNQFNEMFAARNESLTVEQMKQILNIVKEKKGE